MVISATSLSEVSLIAIVPDSECRIPILIGPVSAAFGVATAAGAAEAAAGAAALVVGAGALSPGPLQPRGAKSPSRTKSIRVFISFSHQAGATNIGSRRRASGRLVIVGEGFHAGLTYVSVRVESKERDDRALGMTRQRNVTGRCQMISTRHPLSLTTRWLVPGSFTTNEPAPQLARWSA